MLILKNGRRGILIALVFIIGVVVGATYLSSAIANEVQTDVNKPEYPRNELGLTYGSVADAPSPDLEPDLIRAYGVDGTLGYVYKKELDGELPKKPEEATTIMKERKSERVIPLYEADGVTVIGEFRIGQPQVIEK